MVSDNIHESIDSLTQQTGTLNLNSSDSDSETPNRTIRKVLDDLVGWKDDSHREALVRHH